MDQVLYTYNISRLDKSKKVRFVYLLKGRRDDKGLIEQFKGEFLAPGCFIVPIKNDKEVQSIFKQWGVKPKRKIIRILG